jgi:hypothetical protein
VSVDLAEFHVDHVTKSLLDTYRGLIDPAPTLVAARAVA